MAKTKMNDIAAAARRCYGIIDDIYAVAAMMSTPAQPVTAKQVRVWVGNPRNPTSDYELKRVYPRRTRDRAVSLYVEGELSMAATARKIGCTPGTIKNWLLEADVSFRNVRSSRFAADISRSSSWYRRARSVTCRWLRNANTTQQERNQC